MPITKIQTPNPDSRNNRTPGNLVTITTRAKCNGQQIVGELHSEPLPIGPTRNTTIWVEGTSANQYFIIEMCYHPTFDSDNKFLPEAVETKWGKVGDIVSLKALDSLVAAQTYNDIAYAARVVHVSANGTPTPGSFSVFHWIITG